MAWARTCGPLAGAYDSNPVSTVRNSLNGTGMQAMASEKSQLSQMLLTIGAGGLYSSLAVMQRGVYTEGVWFGRLPVMLRARRKQGCI